jgi:hypothetical protein
MSDTSLETGEQLPFPVEFFVNVPLYKEYGFVRHVDVHHIIKYRGTLDLYCSWCEQDSVFLSNIPGSGNSPIPVEMDMGSGTYVSKDVYISSGVHITSFSCSRSQNHTIYFCTRVLDNKIIKIGQHPSLVDFNTHDIKKYRKILSNDKYKELNRAIGLFSHGIGIGSFVYLRRIFETLIEEAHTKAVQDILWNEEDYRHGKMDNKILLLASYLPTFLVENRGIYSILSKGIHELSEQECLTYFPVIRTGIELILDEKLRERERLEKIQATQQALSKIKGNISR